MFRDYLQEAYKNLRPNNPNWYGWAKVDSEGNKIPNDQRMTYANTIVIEDGVTKPTEEEVNTEIARLEALEYKDKRRGEYPSIGDQLDDLFKAGAFSTEMTATIQAVKDKYPKE